MEPFKLLAGVRKQFLGAFDDSSMSGAYNLSSLLARMECRKQAEAKLPENCKQKIFNVTLNSKMIFILFSRLLVHRTFSDISLYTIRALSLVTSVT